MNMRTFAKAAGTTSLVALVLSLPSYASRRDKVSTKDEVNTNVQLIFVDERTDSAWQIKDVPVHSRSQHPTPPPQLLDEHQKVAPQQLVPKIAEAPAAAEPAAPKIAEAPAATEAAQQTATTDTQPKTAPSANTENSTTPRHQSAKDRYISTPIAKLKGLFKNHEEKAAEEELKEKEITTFKKVVQDKQETLPQRIAKAEEETGATPILHYKLNTLVPPQAKDIQPKIQKVKLSGQAVTHTNNIPKKKVISSNKPQADQLLKRTEPSLGVVSNVKSKTEGGFKKIGPYQVNERSTGLLLPVGSNNRIKTKDNQIEIVLKKPALLSVDKNSSLYLQKILDIHEIILEKGRVRLKLVEGSGLWTLRGRDISISLTPGTDLAMDMTGTLITRVFVFEGAAHCMEATGKKPKLLKAGQQISIGLNDSVTSETRPQTSEFLQSYLNLSGIDGQEEIIIAAAHAFEERPHVQWPVQDKYYNGVLCTECSYAFGKREQALTHCPECKTPLIRKNNRTPLPQASYEKVKVTSNPWFAGIKKIKTKFKR